MIWEILTEIVFIISIFALGYEIAMLKICECMCNVFDTIDPNKADQQFLKGVYFVTDRLKLTIK